MAPTPLSYSTFIAIKFIWIIFLFIFIIIFFFPHITITISLSHLPHLLFKKFITLWFKFKNYITSNSNATWKNNATKYPNKYYCGCIEYQSIRILLIFYHSFYCISLHLLFIFCVKWNIGSIILNLSICFNQCLFIS